MTAQPEPPLVKFAREYGWRAYAVPVLLVITIWVFVDVFSGSGEQESSVTKQATVVTSVEETTVEKGADKETTSRGNGPIPADSPPINLPTGELPAGGPFTQAGDKTYRFVGHPGPKVGTGLDKAVTYVVEVENGVDTATYGGDAAVAQMIDATLANPKSWTADPAFSFQPVGPNDNPSLRIQLTSVGTTHELCGNDISLETSCYTSDGQRVVLNESRWVRGAITAQGDIGSYRQYLINHEVGHALGFAEHAACPKEGELAPIMMQQTLSLNNTELHKLDPKEVYKDDGKSCGFNPWPFPRR